MDGSYVLVGLLAVGAIATQVPKIQSQLQMDQVATTASRQSQQEALTMKVKQEAESGLRTTANLRYDQGCEIVSTLKSPTVAAAIQEDKPIVAGAYADKFSLAAPNPDYYVGRDLTMCDCYGTTAITRFDKSLGYAVAKEIATTSDRKRMASACASRPGMKRPGLQT
jgi:hypothetical protein